MDCVNVRVIKLATLPCKQIGYAATSLFILYNFNTEFEYLTTAHCKANFEAETFSTFSSCSGDFDDSADPGKCVPVQSTDLLV